DVYRYITGQIGTKTFTSFPTNSNPCSGCHNVHIAKRNKAYPGDPTYTAISKPSDHSALWGDGNPDERMSSAAYGTSYQPPLYYTPSTNLEPDGASSDRATQAGKTPDYVTFCTACHTSTASSVWSTTLGGWLKSINWSSTGDYHGQRNGGGGKEAPYNYSNNFVLACTDCHEPHGSPSYRYLIRKEVNGGATDFSGNTRAYWDSLCNRCHPSKLSSHHGSKLCSECHYHGNNF
ncbi:MAG TPA: hypothetical protein ENN18_12965, partial [Proteobacteria bacterium]|nr:hypothetical protein [Pseudomonadota bacterium]